MDKSEFHQVNIHVSNEDYKAYKDSGMKARAVFEFGLRYGSVKQSLNAAEIENQNLQDKILKMHKIITDYGDTVVSKDNQIRELRAELAKIAELQQA